MSNAADSDAFFDEALAQPDKLDPRTLVVADDAFDLAGKRGRYGRPLVVDPRTGQEAEYGRPSKVAKLLDDQTGLIRWAQGMGALGAAENEHLRTRILALDLDGDDWKKTLYNLGEQAKESASVNRGADWGSLIHQTIGAIHRGENPDIPEEIQPAIDVYLATIAARGLTPRPGAIEVPIVNDHHRLAGTFDVAYLTDDGRTLVADWKTNKSPSWLSWGLQLAIYTGATALYDPVKGERIGPPYWDISVGLIVHIDYRDGNATCAIYEFDMEAYTGALLLALEVDKWRKTARRHVSVVTQPYAPATLPLEDRVARLRGIDQGALVDAWTRAGLGKVSELLPSGRAVAADVLDDLEHRLGVDTPTAADWRARLRHLPTDLRAQAEAELRMLTLTDAWLEQMPEAVGVLQRAEHDHAERIGNVTRALDGLGQPDHAACTGGRPIRLLSRTEADAAIACAHARLGGVIAADWTVTIDADVLAKKHGGKAKLLDLGRTLAKRHGLKAPTKAADVAGSPVLTALIEAA